MAGAVSKKEILNIEGLPEDAKKVIESLKGIASAGVELIKILGDTKGLKDLTASLKALNQIQAEFTKFQKQTIDMSLKAERLKQQETKTQQQQNKVKEQSIKLTGQELQLAKLNDTLTKAQAGSYEQLNAQYKKNIILLQQMSAEERNSSVAAKQMIDQNKILVSKLNDLDLQNSRTKRSFNGMQWQVTQLARELPSLAYGVNVFFGAIGNNLPMLIDEVKALQTANKAAAEAGKQTVPVWKQAAVAILNWQTAVIIAITALTLYGKEIKDWISELFNGTNAVQNMNQAIADGNETVKKAKQSMQDEIVQMKLRVILATDNKKADDVRIKSANEILSKYPELFKNMTTEQIMTSKSTMLYNLLSEAIAKSFEAKFAAEQISENYRKIADAEKQLKKGGTWWGDVVRTMNEFNNMVTLGAWNKFNGVYIGDMNVLSDRVKQLKEDNLELFKVFEEGQKGGSDDPFNIKAAKSVFESYSKLQTNETKKIFDERSSFIASDSQTYEQWLKKQITQYANNVDAKIALEQELYDVQNKNKGGKGNEYTYLEQMQDVHERELEREKKNQQELLDSFEGSEITRQQIVKDNELDILEIRRDQIDEELLLVKNGTEEYAKLLNERAKVETDISKTTIEQNIKIRKLQDKEQQYINKEHQNGLKIISDIERKEFVQKSKDIVDATDDEIVQVQTERTKAAGYAIKQAKGNAEKTKQIQQELTIGMIDDEYKAKQKLLLDDLYRNNLTVEDKKKITSRLIDLEGHRAKTESQITVENEQTKQEIRKQIFDKSAELVNAGFDIMQQGYANQLSALEESHKTEVAAAGENVEKRILADRKYEEEKKKIARRQAAAEKAQAAFSIAMNTATAIIGIWAQVPKFDFGISAGVLTAMVAALGAAQLASVLKQEVPAYAKGTKNSESTFIAGEEKSEIIVTPSGDLMVTPDSATLYSDPKLKGSTVIPNPEISNFLANLAMKNTRDVIDMRQTNKHLSNIEKSFKDKDSAPYINAKGKLVVKKGSTTYIYN